MSRFYQELHDRELLIQAEASVRELQQRGLIDVLVPDVDKNDFERKQAVMFPRRLAAIRNEKGRLALHIEESFFS